jgi:hypothetical protein
MGQSEISLTETKNIQEEARKKFADGRYSLADYLDVILKNPLRFSSTNRSRVKLTKEKGKIRVEASQPKITKKE